MNFLFQKNSIFLKEKPFSHKPSRTEKIIENKTKMEETTEIKYCSIKIKLITDETIKVSVISDDKEIPVKLKGNQEEYPCSISFENNKIHICQNNQNSIHFIRDMINNPNEFKEYSIQYQEKEYNVIAEVLLALIVNEFKKKIEKEFIIEETFIEIPTYDYRVDIGIR